MQCKTCDDKPPRGPPPDQYPGGGTVRASDGHPRRIDREDRPRHTTTLARLRPPMLVEIAPFIYEQEKSGEFDDFVGFLRGLGYQFTDAHTGKSVPNEASALRAQIAPGAGINALLLPSRP